MRSSAKRAAQRSGQLISVALLATIVVLVGTSCSAPVAAKHDLATAALASLPLVPQPDARYYDRFAAAAQNSWSRNDYFPIGTWFSSIKSPRDLDTDRALGLNTYVHLTDDSEIQLLAGSGFSALLAQPFTRRAPQVVGHLLGDEVDMKGGPGWGPTIPGAEDRLAPCAVPVQPCGFSVLASAQAQANSAGPGALTWANYGKGVAFWETDQEAATFVNGFADVVSTDLYWYTDPNVCEEARIFRSVPQALCRRAGNYGWLIDRQRELDQYDGREKPIYAFVEIGTPSDGSITIEPQQAAGAVMSSLIHGARGIVYFNHNFGGSCRSYNALRECSGPMPLAIAEVNKQIKELAPALNSPARAYPLGDAVDGTLRVSEDVAYVIAMVDRRTEPGQRTIRLPETLRDWKISAPYERRSLPRTGPDTFVDNFLEESTYHIYRIQK
jgi:hypothetical protein